MNMFKSNGGFTLVELIVVIAILAILASVAVPAYSGYIERAEAVEGQLDRDAMEKAFLAACAMEGADADDYVLDTNGSISVKDGGNGNPTELSEIQSNFSDFYLAANSNQNNQGN